MRALNLAQGQTVTAGEQIGEVGDLGNATGCHLHFEVHPRGGSIYEDNVDPSAWLAEHVGRAQDGAPGPTEAVAAFTVATFNTLGSSHTTATGKHPEMASGPQRTRGLIELLDRHAVDCPVPGLVEAPN
jgi:murein DD-endopeptidase MepM/ murein hydrolase activator NlpD